MTHHERRNPDRQTVSFAFAAELELCLICWEATKVFRGSVPKQQLLSDPRVRGCYRASDLHDALMKLVHDRALETIDTASGEAFFVTPLGRSRAIHFARTSGLNALAPMDRRSLMTARARVTH